MLLGAAFLTSFTYLSYKIYEQFQLSQPPITENENYLILKRMNERFQSGHLQNTPFPTYLEMMNGVGSINPTRRISLCESIERQLERDWNCFLYQTGKFVLK